MRLVDAWRNGATPIQPRGSWIMYLKLTMEGMDKSTATFWALALNHSN